MKLIQIVNFLFDQLAKLLFIFIIVLVFIAALTRKLGAPVAWSIETAKLLFGWVVFLGADMALRQNGHIGIDFVTNKIPVKLQRIIMIMNYIAILLFLGIITGYGIKLCIINFERQLDIIPISNSYATLSVPFGCLLMSITVVRKLIMIFKGEDLNKKIEELKFNKGEGKLWELL